MAPIHNETLLNYVATTSDIEAANILLQNGALVNDLYEPRVGSHDYVKYLIDNDLDNSHVLITHLIEHKWYDLIDVLVRSNAADVLFVAVSIDNTDLVTRVLDISPDLDIDPWWIYTAVGNNNTDIVKLLVNRVDEIPDGVLEDSINRAIQYSNTRIIELLWKYVDGPPSEQNIIDTINRGDLEMAKLLLSYGGKVTPHIFNKFIKALMRSGDVIKTNEEIKFLVLMLAHGANIHQEKEKLLRYALDHGARTATLDLHQQRAIKKYIRRD